MRYICPRYGHIIHCSNTCRQYGGHDLPGCPYPERGGSRACGRYPDIGHPFEALWFFLVREAVRAGVEVQCLPGATAFVPALVSSGLPCDRFAFEGFLPQKKGRQTKLESLKDEERTMIFYESPYRLVKTLQQFAETYGGERQVSVCREISKVHEESVRGTLDEVIAHFKEKEPKGEIVIILAGCGEKPKASKSEPYNNK